MATNNSQQRSLDDMLKESREKRKAEVLAQEIFGRRSRTPATKKPALGASLASRVGVSKARLVDSPRIRRSTDSLQRTQSLPRTNSAPPRQPRAAAQPPLNRPPPRDDNRRARQSFPQPQVQQQQQQQQPLLPPQVIPLDPVAEVKSNGYLAYDDPASNGVGSISIRGVAGPHIVIASNFAPGTTAADIESVMLDVGGQMTECRLVSETPVVAAEMTFVERTGGETVINTFNNKKADGRTLHVYWKSAKEPEFQATPVETDIMEVDEAAQSQSREAENRLREERRGRPEREQGYGDNYYREPIYQGGRQGYGGGGYGPRRYRDDGRLGYSRGYRY